MNARPCLRNASCLSPCKLSEASKDSPVNGTSASFEAAMILLLLNVTRVPCGQHRRPERSGAVSGVADARKTLVL